MIDIVEVMRTGRVCDDKCCVMEAKFGCLCAEAADEIERLRTALEKVAQYTLKDGCECSACEHSAIARAALEGRT